MLFSSAAFLFAFLPLTLLFYFMAPRPAKNHVLLIASLLFYFYGEPVYTFLLLLSAFFNWGMGLLITKASSKKAAARLLFFTVSANLSLLFYYKYSGFFVGIFADLTKIPLSFSPPALPIGISFYTFQAMSYAVDVYRGDARVEKDPLSFATYLCLFPQLIAGPIVRYTEVSQELKDRSHSLGGFADGAFLFVVGLAKKVILADTLAKLVRLWQEGEKSVLFAWLYAVAFTLEIYFDFSGYSDMAVGLGRIFGFSFPRNFDYPYISSSITEFWRRWHITLSSWFKSYVYIPLGGNRKGKARLALNIAVVWLLTGFWHGSSWTFLLWGALYAILLLIEKFGALRLLGRLPRFFGKTVGHLYTLFFVVLGFVLFNAASLPAALSDLGALFGAGAVPLYDRRALYYAKSFLPLLLFSALAATPLFHRLSAFLSAGRSKKADSASPSSFAFWKPAATLTLLILSVSFIAGESFRPFLYFRF